MKTKFFLSTLIVIFINSNSARSQELPTMSANSPSSIGELDERGRELYAKARFLCNSVTQLKQDAPERSRAALLSKQILFSLKFYGNGVLDPFGNPFLLSPVTLEFLRSPGYSLAMNDCFADNNFRKWSFYLSVITLDRLGYITDWVAISQLTGALVGVFKASTFALAHPVLVGRIGKFVMGTSVLAVVVQGANTMHRVWDRHQQRKRIKALVNEPGPILSNGERDASLQIVRERIGELDLEIAQNASPDGLAALIEKRNILQQIIERSSNRQRIG